MVGRGGILPAVAAAGAGVRAGDGVNSLDSFRSKEAKVELELRSSGCKACIHPIVSGLFF